MNGGEPLPITSKQIAALAGVSRGTVDRVLNHRPGVSPQTAEKVLQIARELGYVPNRAGKALSRAGRPLHIGLALNCLNIPFFEPVLEGIESCRRDYSDFPITLTYRKLAGYQAHEQLEALDALAAAGVQGVILTPISAPEIVGRIDRFTQGGIPVVTLNNDIEGTQRMLYVGCDYLSSGRTAAGLIGLMTGGVGAAAVVTGSSSMLGHRLRVQGFWEELGRAYPGLRQAGVIEGEDDDVLCYSRVQKLLREDCGITALYFAAAGAGGGVRAVCEACGSTLPVMVASDEIEETRRFILEGKLRATVTQEPFRQGYEALKGVLEYLISGNLPIEDRMYMHNGIKIAQNL